MENFSAGEQVQVLVLERSSWQTHGGWGQLRAGSQRVSRELTSAALKGQQEWRMGEELRKHMEQGTHRGLWVGVERTREESEMAPR
jgi:hypothetical protein